MSLSLSLSPCLHDPSSSGLLDVLVEPCFLTAGKTLCGKCGVTQAVIGNDCEIVPQKHVEVCLGLREAQQGRAGAGKKQ